MHAYAESEPVDGDERERLILEHLPQVRLIARRIQERLPDNVALEDLVSSGVIGLISAIDHFDASPQRQTQDLRGVQDSGGHSGQPARPGLGARQKRRRAKQIEAAIAAAEQVYQRLPTEEEIAAQLGISLAEYREWLVEIRGLNVTSLEHAPGTPGKDLLHYVADAACSLPSALLERSELERILAEGIDRLPEIERTVLSLYYRDELTLREIATVIGLHESRVSQLKSQAILRLRTDLAASWPASRGMVTA